MKQIILASKSPMKIELLGRLNIKFKSVESGYEEDMALDLKPKELAMFLSLGKAMAVSNKYENSIIIATDTFVVYKNNILGKPDAETEAKEMLKMLSGDKHTLITGYTIIDTATKKKVSEAVETRVYFKKLTEDEIDNYVESKEPLDKAGAYAIQGLGSVLVERIEGSYHNIMGLPLFALAKSLNEFGINII